MNATTVAIDAPADTRRRPSAGDGPGDDPRFETVACCGCGHGASDAFIAAEDDLTGRPGRFTFRRCRACGLVYQTPRLTIERVRDYYDEDYLAHRPRADWGRMSPLVDWAMGAIDREKLRICKRYVALDAQSTVLDVGCGAGAFLARLRERHGSTAVGVDFVDLADRVRIARRTDTRLRRTTAIPGVDEADDLVIRAAQLLRNEFGIDEGADIGVEKRIPPGGGLGGTPRSARAGRILEGGWRSEGLTGNCPGW